MKSSASALSGASSSSASQLANAASGRGAVRASPTMGPAKRWLLRPLQPGQPSSPSSLVPVAALNGTGSYGLTGGEADSPSPFQLSDDPLLRRSQLLLAASRRLRGEEPFPTPLTDGQLDPSAPRPVASPMAPAVMSPVPTFTRVGGSRPALATSFQSDALTQAQADGAAGASLGDLAMAAARLSTASASSTAASGGLLAAAAAAAAVPSLAAPAAASASPASIAASAAATPGAAAWLAIDNLLSEAAYSLSQQLDNTGLGGRTLASKTAVWSSAGSSLPEPLDDLLYSLAAELDALGLTAAGQALAGAAKGAVAGLTGAAAELPRAAAQVYRSAADAAAVATGLSASRNQGVTFITPSPLPPDAGGPDLTQLEPEVLAAAGLTPNPAWDPFGTIRAAEALARGEVVPEGLVVPPALVAKAPAAASAAAPVVTGTPSVSDAATATAVATVEAATAAAAGTIVIPAPAPAPAPAPPAVAAAPAAPAPAPAAVPPPAVAAAGAPPAPTVCPVPGVPESAGVVPPPAVVPPAPAPPVVAAAPPPPPPPPPAAPVVVEAPDVASGDKLASAVQDLLSAGSPPPVDAAAAAATAAVAATKAAAPAALDAPPAPLPADAEAALDKLSDALQRELKAVVGPDVDMEAAAADTSALAEAAGRAVDSALGSLDAGSLEALGQLPPDVRLSSLLGAVLQSALDLVDAAVSGVRQADSEVVGGVALVVVLGLAIRSLVSVVGNTLGGSRAGGAAALKASAGAGPAAGGGAPRTLAEAVAAEGSARATGSRTSRALGVTALEAAALLNNDPRALLLDVRNSGDVYEQGLPDLRPFRRGSGAATAALPYLDFRTTPTLANPSGVIGGSNGVAAAGSSVVAAVDPQFVSRFKQLQGLGRDSRVLLLDSYGVEAPEAVALLRSDPDIERLLGGEGVGFVEGGFAGPEGWKLTGLPVMDPPEPATATAGSGGAGQQGAGTGRPLLRGGPLDTSGLVGGLAALQMRYPALLTRVMAVGAIGGVGVAAASRVDWGAVSRGGVALAALLLVADRALPAGVRPSAKLRSQLQVQLEAPPADSTDAPGQQQQQQQQQQGSGGDKRRAALILRALDLVDAVGDAVVKAGQTAFSAAGGAASAAAKTATSAATSATATAWPSASLGMGSHAAGEALASPARSSASANWRDVIESGAEAAAAAPAAAATTSGSPSISRSPSPGPALAAGISRSLGDAFHSAVSAVKRAASPARQPAAAGSSGGSRSSSPTRSGQAADTRDLVAAVAAASAMNGAAVLPGMGPLTFPKASAGQMPGWTADEQDAEVYAPAAGTPLDADAAAAAALAAIDAALADSGAAPALVPRSASRSSWRDEIAAETAATAPAAASISSSRSVSNWRDQVEAEAARVATAAASADASAVNRQGGDDSRSSSSRRKQPLRTASPQRAAAAAEAMRRLRAEAAGADDDGLRVGVMGGEDKFFGGDSGEWDEVQLERRRESLRAAASADSADEEAGGRQLVTVGVAAGRAATREREVGATEAATARGRTSSRRVVARTLSPERTSEVAAAMRRLRLEAGLPPNDGSSNSNGGGSASSGYGSNGNGNGSSSSNGSSSRYTPSVSPSASAVVPRDWRRELQSSGAEGTDGAGGEQGQGQPQPQRRSGSSRARVVVSAGSRAPSNWRQQVDGGSNGNGSNGSKGGSNGESSPRRNTPAKLSPQERMAREARMRDWRARV